MGSKLTATEAEKIGIVNKVVPHEKLDEELIVILDYYKRAPTKAIGLIKKMLNKSYTSTLEEMLEYEAYCQDIASRTDDYKEGVTAFLEKRKHVFKGQ